MSWPKAPVCVTGCRDRIRGFRQKGAQPFRSFSDPRTFHIELVPDKKALGGSRVDKVYSDGAREVSDAFFDAIQFLNDFRNMGDVWEEFEPVPPAADAPLQPLKPGAWGVESLPDAPQFAIGDWVVPKPGHYLRSGGSMYDGAVVVSLSPFALVSEEGDMLWSTTMKPEMVESRGPAPEMAKFRAFTRARKADYDVPEMVEPAPRSSMAQAVEIDYTNWRGERSKRLIVPTAMRWGSTEYHPTGQWLLDAYDLERKATRTFAMASVHSWRASS